MLLLWLSLFKARFYETYHITAFTVLTNLILLSNRQILC